MTLLRLSLAALVGLAVGTPAASPPAPETPVPPAATAVVVQVPDACRVGSGTSAGAAAPTTSTASAVPAAARRLSTLGAQVEVVCGAGDATAAVIRAASTHRAVLAAGPDVRAAAALAAADHPTVRFTTLR